MLVKRLIALSAIAAGVGLSVPGVAHAGNDAFCKGALVCIYDGNNWVGFLGSRPAGGGVANLSRQANDHMDSWENDTTTRAAWYHDADGRGDCINMNAISEDANINVFDSDEMSSWRTNRGC